MRAADGASCDERCPYRVRTLWLAIAWVAACVIGLLVALGLLLRGPLSEGIPEPLDYSHESSWAALPTKADGADIVPAACGEDRQDEALVDAFYLHPTSWFYGTSNGRTDDPISNLLTESSLFQAANALSVSAAVYAPRYRQASQAVQDQSMTWNWVSDGTSIGNATHEAMLLAYGDIERAFDHFLDTWSAGRPLIVAGHSQGSYHAKRLLGRLASRRPEVLDRLVVAYLVGNTVEAAEMPIPVCNHSNETRCFVAWNTVERGGTAGRHWIGKLRGGDSSRVVCVNPLTWRADTALGARELASGAIPITGHLFLSSLASQIVSAQCGHDGILYTSPVPPERGWAYQPIEPEGRLHAFDYNLFWRDVRTNVRQRVDAYTGIASQAEACVPCADSTRCETAGWPAPTVCRGDRVRVLLPLLCRIWAAASPPQSWRSWNC